eukprot:COSAG05_NODE_398_length_10293_cov_11.919176_15_plen_37_part_00
MASNPFNKKPQKQAAAAPPKGKVLSDDALAKMMAGV